MAISVKNIVTSIDDIPSSWIFEFYGDFPEKLTGQTIVMKSPQKPFQKTGSLRIFYGDGSYKFKDHYTGVGGGPLKFVSYILNIPTTDALFKIIQDFREYGSYDKLDSNMIVPQRYTIEKVNYRKFNKKDKEYWSEYYIRKSTLDLFNVRAIDNIIFSNGVKSFQLGGEMIYGYLNNMGDIYKIYKPHRKVKFLEFDYHMEGINQLIRHDSIVIQASLKDIMSFYELNLPFDSLTTSGESRFLPPHMIYNINETYKNKYVMLDNDETGKKMASLYEPYGYKVININLEKDFSRSIKHHGQEKVKSEFLKQIRK